jgi:hypothetical protein
MADEQTKTSFSIMVEKHAIDHNMLYLTALTEMTEEYGIDPSSINSYITRSLKEKIETESYKLNLFKDEAPASLLDV